MKIISWNVNGIRSVIRKDLWTSFVSEHKPDVILLQETKACENQVTFSDDFMNEYPYRYWKSADKKGYSGVAIFSKIKPLDVLNYPFACSDNEGRLLGVEFEHYYVFSVYVPNSKEDLSRLEYKTTEWDNSFLNYLLYLQQTKPVLVGGDFNVAYDKNMDIWNSKINNVPGATDDERHSFRMFLEHFVDTFREKYPQKVLYSWWSNFSNCRTRNIGWRLDYFLLSKESGIEYYADILCNVMGSDHCPVLYHDLH